MTEKVELDNVTDDHHHQQQHQRQQYQQQQSDGGDYEKISHSRSSSIHTETEEGAKEEVVVVGVEPAITETNEKSSAAAAAAAAAVARTTQEDDQSPSSTTNTIHIQRSEKDGPVNIIINDAVQVGVSGEDGNMNDATTRNDNNTDNTNTNNNNDNNNNTTYTYDQANDIANPSNTTTITSDIMVATTQQQQQQPRKQKETKPSSYPPKSSSTGSASKITGVVPQQSQQGVLGPPPPKTANTRSTTKSSSTAQDYYYKNLDDNKNDSSSDSNDTLLTMSFNQDGGCLAVGTASGFRICNVHPYQETFRRIVGGGGGAAADGGSPNKGAGIAHIEMLYRTNLLAFTGDSNSLIYPPNKVYIYDDHDQRPIGELSFRQKVLSTKLRRDRIVIVLRDRVYIYNFSDLALLDKVHTGDNPLGLVGISTDLGGVGGSSTTSGGVARADVALRMNNNSNGLVLACPGTQRGQVRVELYGLRRTTFVNAHESTLGALALSVDGSLLATASERGTVIRLYDTRGVTMGGGCVGGGGSLEQPTMSSTKPISSSIPLREFRRGVERAKISCLTFSLDSQWLGCASDHGTVHIFQTHDSINKDGAAKNDTITNASATSSMTEKAMRMLPRLVTSPKQFLVDGVQSYAQVRGVPHPHVCAFVPDKERMIAVAGMDDFGNGCLLLAEFGKPHISRSNSRSHGIPTKASENYGVAADSTMDIEVKRVGYYRFFKCKSPIDHIGSSSAIARRRAKNSRDNRSSSGKALSEGAIEGGAYIDDRPVDVRMNHISMGDENEDNFVPIEYNG